MFQKTSSDGSYHTPSMHHQTSVMVEINFPFPSSSLPLLQLTYLELMLDGTHSQEATPEQGPPAPQLDLFAHKLQEVAQQLILLQFAVYMAIDCHEMLNTAWKGKHRCRNTPNIVRAIEQGNKVCDSVFDSV